MRQKRRGRSHAAQTPQAFPMVPDSAAAATVAAAVVVIVAATAAAIVVAATAAGAAAGAAAAAADENEDEDDPQAAVAAPTVVPTHKLEPPVRDGDRRAVSVHLMPQEGRCAPETAYSSPLGRSPRMSSVGLQQRSSRSDMVAAGSFKAPPQRAQNSSTEL